MILVPQILNRRIEEKNRKKTDWQCVQATCFSIHISMKYEKQIFGLKEEIIKQKKRRKTKKNKPKQFKLQTYV